MLEHKSTKIFEISPHPAPKNFLAPLPAPCVRRIKKLYYKLLIRNEPPRESRIYLNLCPLPEIFQPQPAKTDAARRGPAQAKMLCVSKARPSCPSRPRAGSDGSDGSECPPGRLPSPTPPRVGERECRTSRSGILGVGRHHARARRSAEGVFILMEKAVQVGSPFWREASGFTGSSLEHAPRKCMAPASAGRIAFFIV